MVSSDEASLGDQEDASKQVTKIDDIDKDAEITLVDETQGRCGDDLMFDTGVLDDEEVFAGQDMAEKEIHVAEKEVSIVDPVITAGEVVTTSSVEMTVAGHVNVNQEGASNQVRDDAQATQKTDAPIPCSSISSDYAAKFLNFDNIPPTDTEIKDVKELKDIDKSTKVISTIQSEVPKAVKEYLRSSLDDDMYKVIQKNVADIIKEYSVLAKTVERLRQ
ncbi:hypothetical protein Tco_1327940 [Tanacetum coccineum]